MITYHNSGSFPYGIHTGLHYFNGDVSDLPNKDETGAGGLYIPYVDEYTNNHYAGLFIPYNMDCIYIKKKMIYFQR